MLQKGLKTKLEEACCYRACCTERTAWFVLGTAGNTGRVPKQCDFGLESRAIVGPPQTFDQRCSCPGMVVALDAHGDSEVKVVKADLGHLQTDPMKCLAGYTPFVDRIPPSLMEKRTPFPSAVWPCRVTEPEYCRQDSDKPAQLDEKQLDCLHGKMNLLDWCTCQRLVDLENNPTVLVPVVDRMRPYCPVRQTFGVSLEARCIPVGNPSKTRGRSSDFAQKPLALEH